MNVIKDNPSKPGTAIAWKRTLLIKEVFTLVVGRLQVALLGKVAIINLYAPSGTDKKHEREWFFSRDVFSVLICFPVIHTSSQVILTVCSAHLILKMVWDLTKNLLLLSGS